MSARRRAAVLISGRGSNMLSLVAAAREPGYPAEIALVISNNADAAGLAAAARAGVPVLAVDHRPFCGDRAAHEAAIDAALREAGAELVCLAGYMRVLTPFLIEAWRGRMINIHPSLLPAFAGLNTHARALAAGVRVHGCTVHFVNEGVDEGKVIAQAVVPVLPGDSEDVLAARVLAAEHRLYPLALAMAAGGEPGWAAPDAVLFNPLPGAVPGP